MKHKEVIELVNDIQSYIFLTTAEELSFTTTLKVDEYFSKLRYKLEKEEYDRDRIKKGNRKA
jgi:hypothetical protein